MKRSEKQLLATYEWLQRHSQRLSSQDAYHFMEWCVENGYFALMLWKIPSKDYRKWYNEHKKILKTTIHDETTYIVSSHNKAFNSNMGGYSIFATSIGALKRHFKYGTMREIDRIETFQCEYAIVIQFGKVDQQ